MAEITEEQFKSLQQLCEFDLQWGTIAFHLDRWEVIHFEECLKYAYLGVRPKYQMEDFECDIITEAWENVRVDVYALLLAVKNIYKNRLRSYRELLMPKDHYWDICMGESEDYSVVLGGSDCMAAELAADTSENNRLKYFLNNASKITITKKDGKIVKCQILTKNVGSMLLSESYINILNEEELDKEPIASFKRGSLSFEDKEDIKAFRDIVLQYVIYPFGDDKFMYGEKRNSIRKRFIETMYPIADMIDKKFRALNTPLFKEMSKRDIYKFILKLLDAEDLFSVEIMERYLKTENKNAKYNFDWMEEDPKDDVQRDIVFRTIPLNASA